jgi:putative proteasome-type protease
MTYCVAATASTGIVFASDCRTSAGTADVSTFSKMTVFEAPGERVVVLLAAGNLATSQSVVTLLEEGRTLMAKPSLYEVAETVGAALREVMARDAAALEKARIAAGATFLLGGQVRNEPPRLFQVYEEGNFVEATRDTTYFQLGEARYAKPLLDAVLRFDIALDDAAKCLLLAMEATMRLNVAVGAPIDLLAYGKDELKVSRRRRLGESDPYLACLPALWTAGMRELCARAPAVAWH